MRQFPVVALIGARQTGKSTLARGLASAWATGATAFDLEDRRSVARLGEPTLTLEPLRGLVILDEIQRRPDLFPTLRVLADRRRRPASFLVLGSAAPELLQQSSETLAGRIAYHHLPGFDLHEVKPRALDQLWLRGGFPLSFNARNDVESTRWRQQFIRTFAERELAALQLKLSPAVIERFWHMLAHYHGQIWNGSELAKSFAVSEKTVKHYLDVLCATFMARRLNPWHENIGKREVKAPKVYLTDSGLLHALLGLGNRADVMGHPKSGASWEGFAIGQIVQRLEADAKECFFWAMHGGAELDLLVLRGTRRLGFEVKLTDAPRVTPSMRSALTTLRLDHLYAIHAGRDTFPMGERITALAAQRLWADLPRLR